MKKLVWLASIAAVATTSSVFAEEVHFPAVNPVLQAIADVTVMNDDMVEFARPKFDEAFSDLKAERLKYDLKASLKDIPWLDGGRADAIASVTLTTDRTPEHTGINSTLTAGLKTDFLALARYAGFLALRKSNGYNPEFQAKIIGHLKRLSVAQTLDEVYSLLVSAQQLTLEVIQSRVNEEVKYLKCIESNQCDADTRPGAKEESIARAKKSINDWQSILASYKGVVFDTQKDHDKVVKITIRGTNNLGFGSYLPVSTPQPGHAQVELTTDSVMETCQVFAFVRLEKLNQMKSDLNGYLLGVQNGNPVDKDTVQNAYRNALVLFKKVARGQNHY